MKKTKAKPVKGSARVKKFDDGGLAALAGLGALAYMMRKKKGDSEASVPTDKSGYSSGPVNVGKMIEGKGDEAESMSAEAKRAMDASKGRPELIPEGTTDADRATMYGDTVAKRTMPTPKPKARTASQTFPLSTPAKESAVAPRAKATDKVGAGYEGLTTLPKSTPNEERPSKPYPEKEAAAKKAEAAKSAKGFGPKLTFLTPKRLDEAKEAMRRAREGMKKGGTVKKYASGGSVSSASKRADGIAQRGKTKGRIC
jgi:hypothetical protein